MSLLIKGGRVIDPSQKIDETLDVLVEEGKIKEMGKGLKAPGAEVIDAKGMFVVPGPHRHACSPARSRAGVQGRYRHRHPGRGGRRVHFCCLHA